MQPNFGLNSRNTLRTASSADTVSPFDVITGTNSGDNLIGTVGADTIEALGGDDRIRGSLGSDRTDGGSGSDSVDYTGAVSSGVTVVLGGGSEGFGKGGLAEGDVLISIENVRGTKFDDLIVGDDRDNIITGFGGSNDTLKGGGGDDILGGGGMLDGGEGSDHLLGHIGADTLIGGDGDDLFDGNKGADRLDGGVGEDTATYAVSDNGVQVLLGALGTGFGGEAEGDTLIGIENLFGSRFGDTLAGDDGSNRLFGGTGDDVLKGLGGADVLDGGFGNDTLEGGAGDDVMLGAVGADVHCGDGGIDSIDYGDSDAGVQVNLLFNTGFGGHAAGDTFFGMEIVEGSIFSDFILGDDLANEILGDEGADHLTGFDGVDRLFGGEGTDSLFGGSGNDRLNGGSGSDTMQGGAGDDIYVADSRRDVIQEVPGASSGVDWVESAISFALDHSNVTGAIENLTLTGTAHSYGAGNGFNNTIIGNSGNNHLSGRGGADRMAGGVGNDTYTVENVDDVVDEGTPGSSGIDEVSSTVSFSLSGPQVKGSVENLNLTGGAAINGTGSSLSNVIDGNDFANQLSGLAGNDTLRGGLGADTFVFNASLNASTKVDVILDFDVAQDTMHLENAFMSKLGAGQLASGAFHLGSAAHDASDRVIYNKANGNLLYDADGTGSGAAVLFADLSTGLALTSADFFVV